MHEFLFVIRCNGIIGIPVTFLDKFCEDQFKIIGLANGKDNLLEINTTKDYCLYKEMKQGNIATGSSGKKINGNPVLEGLPEKGNYFIGPNNEVVHSAYARIFITIKESINDC